MTLQSQCWISILLIAATGSFAAPAQSGPQSGQQEADYATLSRIFPEVTPPPPSPAAKADAARSEMDDPDEGDNDADDNPPSPPGRLLVDDEAVDLVTLPDGKNASSSGRARIQSGNKSPGTSPSITGAPSPGEFIIGEKHSNPNLAGTSIVVEPSVSNQSRDVIFLSNDRADYSTDGGATFNRLKMPKGPAIAPIFCCDQTIVYDPSYSMWIWSALYQPSGTKSSVIVISVMRNLPTIDCTYTYDPAGGANNMTVDYPQLGLGDNSFYLSTSESQNGWLRARMLRFALSDISTCPSAVLGRVISYSPPAKRMWTPVRGAKEIMYWANFENTTQLRVWTWPESDNAASWTLETVEQTTFANSDCRGGANNQDWIESKGHHITEGFLRGALARGGVGSDIPAQNRLQFFWNGAKDAKHKQAYVRSAVLELPDLKVLKEPNIHNPDFCFGYADAYPNSRGDLGIVVAFGGRDGGNGRALGSGVGIEDEFTPEYRLKTVYVTTDGTDMPSSANKSRDQRYGDYLSVKPHEPCSLWWIAGNYALINGGKTPKANYVEFGRYRDQGCWDRWKDITPPSLP